MRPEERAGVSPAVDHSVSCILCKTADENKVTGPLSRKNGIAAHQNCLLFASGIYCKHSPTFDDLFGFDVDDVKEEFRRGRKLKCFICKKNGATAGCEVKSCKRCYHYPCTPKARAVSTEDPSKGTYRIYCEKHNPNIRSEGSEKGDANVLPSTSGHHDGSDPCYAPLLSSPAPPSCSVVSSSTKLQSPSFVLLYPLSDSDTPRRLTGVKRKHLDFCFDSDETQTIDPVFAPVESEHEDNTLPKQNKQPKSDAEDKSTDKTEPSQGVAPSPGSIYNDVDGDLELESQSLLLPEYRQENVPFTVLHDSGPSIESENSPAPCSPTASSPADTTLSNLDQSDSVPEKAAALHSNITIPLNPPVSAQPCPDSPQSCATGESSNIEGALCVDIPVNAERCASRDIPPLQMKADVKHPPDHPLDLTAPGGCCVEHVQLGERKGHASTSDLGAALFWKRCNDVGCTEAIFTELKRQLDSLAERVQNQHATQEDCAVSLRILEASGKLPAIFRQMEQDLEDQERQLQRKREALRDAKALLDENQLS